MENSWKVKLYSGPRGDVPVVEFLQQLNRSGNRKAATKIIHGIDALRELGFSAPDDLVRKVRDELWELRVTYQRNPYRILFYDAGDQTFVLLHIFHKKEDAIAESDILKAQRRMADHEQRKG